MELNDDVNVSGNTNKFKELVKKYHPDKNQGNKEELKKITLAYSQLKKTLEKEMNQNNFYKKLISNFLLNKLLGLIAI